MGNKVGENPAALRAAVFLLSAKNRRGGCSNTPPPPSRAKVKLRAPSGKVVVCNAFLDRGSSGCFGTENLAQKLEISVKQTTVSASTVCGQGEAVESSMMDNVQVSGIDGEAWHQLPTVFTLQNLPVTIEGR